MSALAILALALVTVPAEGAFSRSASGTSGALPLRLAAGARPAAMGEAFGAVSDDPFCLFYNPAGFATMTHRNASFMHSVYFADSYFDSAVMATPLSIGVLGFGFQYFSAGSITETDAAGVAVGSFNPNDMALTATYSVAVSSGGTTVLRGSSFGIGAKWIRSQVISTAQTAALDVGWQSRPWLSERLRFAFSASNIGGRLRFEAADESLPVLLRFGSAWTSQWGLGTMDIGLPRDNSPFIGLGLERGLIVGPGTSLRFRAGFNSRTISEMEGFNAVSLGIGLARRRFNADYALVPFGGIGIAHRMSIGLQF